MVLDFKGAKLKNIFKNDELFCNRFFMLSQRNIIPKILSLYKE